MVSSSVATRPRVVPRLLRAALVSPLRSGRVARARADLDLHGEALLARRPQRQAAQLAVLGRQLLLAVDSDRQARHRILGLAHLEAQLADAFAVARHRHEAVERRAGL